MTFEEDIDELTTKLKDIPKSKLKEAQFIGRINKYIEDMCKAEEILEED